MCWSPHPSLILFGTIFLRRPVRFGVWYILISTRSCPNSSTSGASNDAEHTPGVSRVPLRPSVITLSLRFGFDLSASRKVSIYWQSQHHALQSRNVATNKLILALSYVQRAQEYPLLCIPYFLLYHNPSVPPVPTSRARQPTFKVS